MVERFKGDGAQDYDQRISRLVPGYALLHQLSAAQLMTRLGPRARALLVGVGTGSELLLLGQSCPEWQFIAQDISADMLAQARQRAELADMAERVTWWEGPLPAQSLGCDGALCLLVLHFLPFEQKTALLRDIARQLRAGSPLLMADLMAAQDDTERAVMGLQAHLAGLPLSASEQMIQRLERDFFPLNEDQTRQLLGAAGFGTGWRYFQALGFHGWLAERDGSYSSASNCCLMGRPPA